MAEPDFRRFCIRHRYASRTTAPKASEHLHLRGERLAELGVCLLNLGELPGRLADSGRPFSRRVTAAMHDLLTDRELDVCDTAYLYCAKFWKDVDLDSIVIDVSDNPNRKPWTDGNTARTLSTSVKLVHNRNWCGSRRFSI